MAKNTANTVDMIKQYLLDNGYGPGDRIPVQSDLSAALGISSRRLHDGINILVTQGFLIPKGRAGTFMSNPRRESVVEPIRWFYEIKNVSGYELIQARVVLEKAIIAEACSNRTTKDVLLLQEIVDSQTAGKLTADQELETDKQFHLHLINCAHNKALDIVGNVILLQLDLLYERGLYPQNDRLRPDDHQQIVDAIYARDIESATQLIEKHIERCCTLANEAETNPLEL